jgi:hypothetical protein
MTISLLLAQTANRHGIFSLLPHGLDPDPPGLEDDAMKNSGDALAAQRSLVGVAHARQDLTLATAVICGQTGRDLDRAQLARYGRTLAEQSQQRVIDAVDFTPPLFEPSGIAFCDFVHALFPIVPDLAHRPKKQKPQP